MICDFLASFSAPAGDTARGRRPGQRSAGSSRPSADRPARPRRLESEVPSSGGKQVRS